MEFKEKFIAFVDILGFKALVAATEKGQGMPLAEILEIAEKLGRAGEREFFEHHGPKMCPAASCVRRDLDFRATQISDCVVLSAEISPAGGINLLSQAWMAVAELLGRGLLCRGYVTRGLIYHTGSQFIGTGYQTAVEGEKLVTAFSRSADDRGTPFVEIDPGVRDYLKQSDDGCVREMFSRLVKDDGTVAALFPFQLFSAKFAIDEHFDPAKQKTSNHNLRVRLGTMKTQMLKYIDRSNPSAIRKSEHYLAALDTQLEVCDRTDRLIEGLSRPFPGGS